MNLANGLYLYLPPKGEFVYPAGDQICKEAIGRIKKDSDGICVSGERGELNVGYVKKATGANGTDMETGVWIITKIRNARFEKKKPGEVNLLKVDIRGPGSFGTKQIRNAILHTALLSINSLFQN